MLYLNSTLNFGIPPVLVFQLEVYYKVDRLLTGLTALQKGTTARWYSNLYIYLLSPANYSNSVCCNSTDVVCSAPDCIRRPSRQIVCHPTEK